MSARKVSNILIVDDRPEGLIALESILKDPGYRLITANSGREALAQVLAHDFAVILMDVQMPGMDGYESTTRIRRLKHQNASLPIVALTANAMVGDSEKCFDAGMNDYVTKPINSDLLRGVIIKWAGTHLAAHP